MNQLLQRLQEELGPKLKHSKDIWPYFTLKTKTMAEYFYEAETFEEWEKLISLTHRLGIPLFILGGGSNLAVVHDTISGLVVRNLYRERKQIAETEKTIDMQISSGYIVNALVHETTKEGLSGFEFHLGLPGTVGGAIYMNSKWTITDPVSYFGDALITARLIDKTGAIREVERPYFKFAYDYSYIQETGEFVADAVFRLRKEKAEKLIAKAQESLDYRKKTQPIGVSTAGCFFKNISIADRDRLQLKTTSAGYLIDSCGLKNKQSGAFVVSDKHANFIVNTGNGKASDLLALVQLIKETVKNKYGIEMEEEVKII
jgi:UDP-N-acetylmuramate dehydrogenase